MEQYKKVGNLKVRTDLSPEKQALVNQIAQNYVNQNKKIDAEARKGYLRGGLGSVVSGLSFHPILNVPYVGTGIGGAMYDLGQGIVAGEKAKDLAKRAARGFAIGETVGAIPYVGKAAAKTKAGQAVVKKLDKVGEKVAQNPAVQKAYDTLMTDIKAFNPNNQTVYHASPYDFEKFSNEAIGTGEGAQAHGYGHYAALDKNIADNRYRKRLLRTVEEREVDSKYKPLFDKEQKIFDAKSRELYNLRFKDNKLSEEEYQKGIDEASKKTYEILDEWHNAINNIDKTKATKETGQLYKLSVPKDDVMWREGLEPHNQPKKVQEIYDKVYKQDAAKIDEKYNTQIDNWKNAQINAWNKLSDYKLGDKSKYAKNLLQAELSEDKNLIDKAWNDYEKNIGFNNNFDPNEVYHYKRDIQDHIFDLNTEKEQEKFWELGRGGYTDFNDPQNVKKWSNAGIKGISYNGGIDGEARVIFNPDDIVIGRKYYNQPTLKDIYNKFINSGAIAGAITNP